MAEHLVDEPAKQDHYRLFAGLFVLSGISGLVYQVVWARKLQVAFGVNLFAIAAVLAAYFLGMALGSWLGGKYSDRTARPLLAYALIEIGIGVTAFIVTPFVDQLNLVLQPFSELLNHHFYLLQAARFLLTLAVLIIPTTLLGATVPFINRGVVIRDIHIGNRIATLYAANTLGAVVGVLFSGFYLIEHIGLTPTAQLAAALSVLVGLLAWWLARYVDPVQLPKPAASQSSGINKPHPAARVVLPVMALSGALGLSLEVLWTRILIQGIGSTAYVFSIVLALFLAGIALGSYIVRRRVDHWKDLYSALAISQALAALFTLAGVPVLNWVMPPFVSGIMGLFGLDIEQAFFQTWALWAVGALLPATVALGAGLPIAARLIADNRHCVGRSMGRLYAVNTYGGVIGSLCTGFLLLPRVGVYWTITLVSALYLLAAVILIFQAEAVKSGRKRHALAPVGLSFLAWFFLPPSLVYDRVTNYTTGRIVDYQEDYYGSILVTEEVDDNGPYKRLLVNGTSYSGTGQYAVHYMRLQGHLPLFMSQAPLKESLVICLGVGLTAGAITTHPNTGLTVVELSRAIVGLSPLFSEVNEKVYQNPAVRLVTDDGRNYLVRNPEKRFDVITLEPPPPVLAGMANLYSLDFYRLTRQHLTEKGVVVQWIPLHTQSNADTRMLIATFLEVFPNASLWWTESGETLILGRIDDAPLQQGHFQALMSNAGVARSLREIGIDTPEQLAAHFLLDRQGLKAIAGNSTIMNDDLPVIEYRVPLFNGDYQPLLNDVFRHRPGNNQIATELGFVPEESGEKIRQAWSELKSLWYQETSD